MGLHAQDGTEAYFRKWALTPPMGWNSWDCFGSTVVESEVLENAEYMQKHLKQYGWEYVVVDIRWYISNPKPYYNTTNQIYNMDEYGRYIPPVNRFPSAANGKGFKALADKIHDMGLKFGIHIMRGLPIEAAKKKLPVKGGNGITCDQICNNDSACFWLYDNYKVITSPEGQLYYNSIFDLYAEWGVDFVKIDDLSRPVHKGEISMIRKAIDQCGRPIVLSLSPGKTDINQGEFVAEHANQWRMIDDLWDRWSDVYSIFSEAHNWEKYYRPGCYPDADMLPIGALDYNPDRTNWRQSRLTPNEQQTLMNLWGITHSPLMYGGHLPENGTWEDSLMTNTDLIEMSKYSVAAREVSNNYGKVMWGAINPATGGRYAALFNLRGGSDKWYSTEGAMHITDAIAYTTSGYAEEVEIDIPDYTYELALVCDDAGDGNGYDHGDWINPCYILDDGSELPVDGLADILYTNTENAWESYRYVNVDKNLVGEKLAINGVQYEKGFSCHASSMIVIRLPKLADGRKIKKFKVLCGIDDSSTCHEGSTASMKFMIFNFDPTPRDNCEAAAAIGYSGLITRDNHIEGVELVADIRNTSKLQLVVTNGMDNFFYDRANWVNPVLIDKDGKETSLTTLTADSYVSDFGSLQINKNVDGGKLNIGGTEYAVGLGMNAQSVAVYTLPADGNYVAFKAKVGLDYSVVKDAPAGKEHATAEFMVFGDRVASDAKMPVPLSLTALGLDKNQRCRITDLWSKENLGVFKDNEYQPILDAHQSGLYYIELLEREKSNSLSIKGNIIGADSASIEVTIHGVTDENSYVQILCDDKVIGCISADGCTDVAYLATQMKGKHVFRAKYSGTASTANCESSDLEIDFSSAGIKLCTSDIAE